MGMKSEPRDSGKSAGAAVKFGVDHRNYTQPPLDFSFRSIQLIDELVKIADDVVQPRWYVLAQPKQCKVLEHSWEMRMAELRAHLKREEQQRLEGQKPIPRMDVWTHIERGEVDAVLGNCSPMSGNGCGGGGGGTGATGGATGPVAGGGTVSASSLLGRPKEVNLPKLDAEFLRINNNRLENINGFTRVVRLLLVDPFKLSWLDLSFNKLVSISEELPQFKQLKSLYLHGNNIADISEVEKLSVLTSLITLTLHGNGLHGLDDYQSFVITTLPSIKSLDFVCVTPDMKRMATRWETVCGKGKIKSQGKALRQFEEKMRGLEKND